MTTTTIDPNSPERAWPPFMDWLISQGINPASTRAISFDPETMAGQVTVLKRNKAGKFYADGDDVATETRTIRFQSLPPRRVSPPG